MYLCIKYKFLNKLYDSDDENDDNISFKKPESPYNDNSIQNEFDSNIEYKSEYSPLSFFNDSFKYFFCGI
jgi:hypothetical protein